MEEKKMKQVNRFFKDESGASAVEYGLLVALIACVIIATVSTVGKNLNTKFNSVAGQLS
jgi:pilus assembly protein Flp/PilA